MKAQCAKRLGKEIQGNTEVLRGVGGECMSLDEVRVKFRCDEHEVDETTMRVVEDNVFTGPDVIIGTDIIDHPHLVLIRKHGQTALVDERRYPFLQDFHVEMDDNRVVLRASETVTVPKNCIHNGHNRRAPGYVVQSGRGGVASKCSRSRYDDVGPRSPADIPVELGPRTQTTLIFTVRHSINWSPATAARMEETVGDRGDADEWHALTASVESECKRISVGVSPPVAVSRSASSTPRRSARSSASRESSPGGSRILEVEPKARQQAAAVVEPDSGSVAASQ
ncbi:hypothetical protein HPB47_025540 [Ixodes persulcatus]|uniref:Uncharacterized protein n=1 Tax=Ixodes persulcatus TaxID=34615 RepID=A0AC60Q1E6_IXOPE|nr:hypothetical protein HPB47_025540 [Ixodes persulcatus]